MAKNLVNGTNVIIEENSDNINMNLSSTYTNNLNQTIADSFKNNNVFSANETVVGKWINNKPIYRKIIHKTVNANSSDSTTNLKVLNYEKIWIDFGNSFSHYGGNTLTSSSITFYTSSSDMNHCYVNYNGILVINNTSTYSREYFITVNYTKTTDVAS